MAYGDEHEIEYDVVAGAFAADKDSFVFVANRPAEDAAVDEPVVSVRKDSGEAHLDYLKITLENTIGKAASKGVDHEEQIDVSESFWDLG